MKKKIYQFSVLVLVITIFSACSASYKSKSSGSVGGYTYYSNLNQSNADGWEYNEQSNGGFVLNKSTDLESVESEEKIKPMIQYDAYLRLIIEDADTVNAKVKEIAAKYGGYVNTSGTSFIKLRVKSGSFNDALEEIAKLGKLDSKRVTGEDVTNQYYDYKIRLENAEKARKRYLELLEKAEDVEATLAVEKELERLNEKIDLIKGNMNRTKHLTQYSTISINLEQKKKPGIIGYVFVGLYKSVKWLFVRN